MKRFMFHFPELSLLLKATFIVHAFAFFFALFMHTPHGLSYFSWASTGEGFIRQWVVFIWIIQHAVMGVLAYFLWHPFAKWMPYMARLGRLKTVGLLCLTYSASVFISLSMSTLFTVVLSIYYAVSLDFMGALIKTIALWSLMIGIGMGLGLKPMIGIALSSLQIMLFWLEPDISLLHGWWPLFFLSSMDSAPINLWQIGTLIFVGISAMGFIALRKDLL